MIPAVRPIRQPLDTVLERETPEGIALELRPAGLPARAGAYLLDLLIRGAFFYALVLASQLLGTLAPAVLLISWFLLEWFYPVLFELARSGATPGKSVMGLKVVMDSGLPVTPGASIARNLLRTADFMPFVYALGITSMLVRGDFRRIGDIAAATLVVHRPAATRKPELAHVTPRPPAVELDLQQQRALAALAARAPQLTTARLHELAALAAPATGTRQVPGTELTEQVLATALWLLGKRS